MPISVRAHVATSQPRAGLLTLLARLKDQSQRSNEARGLCMLQGRIKRLPLNKVDISTFVLWIVWIVDCGLWIVDCGLFVVFPVSSNCAMGFFFVCPLVLVLVFAVRCKTTKKSEVELLGYCGANSERLNLDNLTVKHKTTKQTKQTQTQTQNKNKHKTKTNTKQQNKTNTKQTQNKHKTNTKQTQNKQNKHKHKTNTKTNTKQQTNTKQTQSKNKTNTKQKQSKRTNYACSRFNHECGCGHLVFTMH